VHHSVLQAPSSQIKETEFPEDLLCAHFFVEHFSTIFSLGYVTSGEVVKEEQNEFWQVTAWWT
jgi:hypothetical protein